MLGARRNEQFNKVKNKMNPIVYQITFLFIAATIGGFIARSLKQPLLPFYILAGLIAGPILHFVGPSDIILSLAETGIAFLLFIVGIDLNLVGHKTKSKVILYSAITGVIQIVLFFAGGLLLGKIFGFDKLTSFYIACAITFSSTMVIVKILADKQELFTVHGKAALTILLIQDLFAIIAIGFVTSVGKFDFTQTSFVFLKIIALIAAAIILNKAIYPRLFKFVAKSKELLFLTTVAVCLGFGIVSQLWGLSIAIGAFIAGVSLSTLEFSYEMGAVVRPLRDFFATLFFISLGLLVIPAAIKANWVLILAIILVTIILKPLIIFLLLNLFKFRSSSSLKSSLAFGQVSEFALVIGGLGLSYGHIDNNFFSIITCALIVTVVISTYFISYSRFFAKKFESLAKIIERSDPSASEPAQIELKNHAIIFGYHRTGEKIVETIKKIDLDVLVVDFNPDVIDELDAAKINHLFGDMGDKEILEKANIKSASIIVSTIPDVKQNSMMVEEVRSKNPKATIYVSAKEIEEALELYESGADYVILPHFLGGLHTSLLIERFAGNQEQLIKIKEEHLDQLKKDLKKHKNNGRV